MYVSLRKPSYALRGVARYSCVPYMLSAGSLEAAAAARGLRRGGNDGIAFLAKAQGVRLQSYA